MNDITLIHPISTDINRMIKLMRETVHGISEDHSMREVVFLDLGQTTHIGAEVYFDLRDKFPTVEIHV